MAPDSKGHHSQKAVSECPLLGASLPYTAVQVKCGGQGAPAARHATFAVSRAGENPSPAGLDGLGHQPAPRPRLARRHPTNKNQKITFCGAQGCLMNSTTTSTLTIPILLSQAHQLSLRSQPLLKARPGSLDLGAGELQRAAVIDHLIH